MQCTVKKTLKAVRESGNEAIVQVKNNQKKLYELCKKIEQKEEMEDRYKPETEKGHGRIENRETTVYEMEAWEGLIKRLIIVDRRTKIFNNVKQMWEKREEKSYYVSSCEISAELAYEGIRGHWSIENKENWVKDVSMGEDACRIKKNAATMGRLRSKALNELRKEGTRNIREALIMNAMDIKRVIKYC